MIDFVLFIFYSSLILDSYNLKKKKKKKTLNILHSLTHFSQRFKKLKWTYDTKLAQNSNLIWNLIRFPISFDYIYIYIYLIHVKNHA